MNRLALSLVLLLFLALFGGQTQAQTKTYTEFASSGVCGGSQNCQATFPDGSKLYLYFSAVSPYDIAFSYVGHNCGYYGCVGPYPYNIGEGSPFCGQASCADANMSGRVGEIDFNRAIVSQNGQPTGQIAVGKIRFLYGKNCGRCAYSVHNISLSYELQ
jgi:hypothetical protein